MKRSAVQISLLSSSIDVCTSINQLLSNFDLVPKTGCCGAISKFSKNIQQGQTLPITKPGTWVKMTSQYDC